MPPSLSHIHTVVTAYLDRHSGERDALADLLAAWDAGAEPTNRTTLPAHITCSAVVIDRHRRVLHIRPKASGGLLLAPAGTSRRTTALSLPRPCARSRRRPGSQPRLSS